jgi:DNA-binding CsgD family transcriptional regulator
MRKLASVQDFVKNGRVREVITPRERTVVRLIAEGHSSKSIAAMLGLSLKTIETHRRAITRKLNLSNAADIVRYAVRNGIVDD